MFSNTGGPTGFSSAHPAASPPPRRDSAIAYDDAMQKVVMFGGWNPVVGGAAKLNDTKDLGRHFLAAPASDNRPSKRGGAVMAYDPRAHQLVMFGGDIGQSTNETWIFDGSNWSLLRTPSPTSREATVMAPDANGNLIVFGGEAPIPQPAGYVGEDFGVEPDNVLRVEVYGLLARIWQPSASAVVRLNDAKGLAILADRFTPNSSHTSADSIRRCHKQLPGRKFLNEDFAVGAVPETLDSTRKRHNVAVAHPSNLDDLHEEGIYAYIPLVKSARG